jgi:hypothetical protein
MFTEIESPIPSCWPTLSRQRILFAVLAYLLLTNVASGQTGTAPTQQQTASANSVPKPDYLPDGAVAEGAGYSAPAPLASQWETFFAWTIHLDEAAVGEMGT